MYCLEEGRVLSGAGRAGMVSARYERAPRVESIDLWAMICRFWGQKSTYRPQRVDFWPEIRHVSPDVSILSPKIDISAGCVDAFDRSVPNPVPGQGLRYTAQLLINVTNGRSMDHADRGRAGDDAVNKSVGKPVNECVNNAVDNVRSVGRG